MSRRTRRRRADASYGPEVGTTYLLHFIDPATGEPARYKHAGHYIGWTTDLAARLEAHARGGGARLVEVITRAGLGFTLARTWPQTTRDREDLLKHIGDARRFCPECGVKPRQEPAAVMPEPRQSLRELERAGTWLDGTPLPQITTYPAPAALHQAASRKENEMFGRQRRAAARQEAAQQAEADRLFALADELDRQAGERPDYRQQITAERAARIRRELGKDLASEAAAQAAEPTLQGADLDAEIDRLAGQFPEPLPATQAPGAEPGIDAARWVPGQEPGELEVIGGLLSQHAAQADEARRRERRALAHERLAQLAHDEEGLWQARTRALIARGERQGATADAYVAAARLQRAGLGPLPQGADGIYQHAAGYVGWSPDVTSRMAEHQLEAG
jgi:predicted GIY-YIG superfamily endonuclease